MSVDTFTLSEFSSNPSAALRAADRNGIALLTRRGRVAYRVVPELSESWLDGLIRRGLATAATGRFADIANTSATSVDLERQLAADRAVS